jgi:glycosyltransferase involved in cell wall biosynthesis
MNVNDNRRGGLAIIVPVYKIQFLERALESLKRQSMNQARIYIFDDASPHPVEATVRKCMADASLPWVYERFEKNMGGVSLTGHYDRCVRKTTEDWVWIFSDDDLMEADCIGGFWKTIEATNGESDLYCFDSLEIDSSEKVISLHPPLPEWESWKQHAYFIFRTCRFVPQQAMVFSRAAFETLGGFIPFPLAWASDFATAIALGRRRGIRRISDGKIHFRTSGQNVSSSDEGDRATQKVMADLQFIRWFFQKIEAEPDAHFPLSDEILRHTALSWLKKQLIAFHVWYGFERSREVIRFLNEVCHESRSKAALRMIDLNFRMLFYSIRSLKFS